MARRMLGPLFAALMGFAIGGSPVWAIAQPDHRERVRGSAAVSISASDQHQSALTWGQGLSRIWDRTWDDPVAFYTFVLGIFTALLAIVSATQIIFLVRTDKLTRISANAAQKSAEALPAVERGYVFLELGYYGFQLESIKTPTEHSPLKSLSVRFGFINHGKTPVIISELRAGIERTVDILPADAWTKEEIIHLKRNVLGSEMTVQPPIEMYDGISLAEEDAELIRTGALFIYFFGHLAYQDVFGLDRETQFCFRLSGDQFEEWGGRVHNFRT